MVRCWKRGCHRYFEHLNELSGQCVALNGSLGVFIEDASMGSILLQKGESLAGRSTKLSQR
jgi:hypothetical protein